MEERPAAPAPSPSQLLLAEKIRERIRRETGMELSVEEALALQGAPAPSAERFGPFLIERKLGHGGMGVVYLARRAGDPRPLALKILSPKLESSTECILRFHREAEIAIRISHPNIVRGYELGVIEERRYYSMEFVDGPRLDRLLAAAGRLDEASALDVALQLARALEAVAAEGLVHRDVNPSNALVGFDGSVKLTDFGLARSAGGKLMPLTRVGRVRGTPYYMAPEQIRESRDLDIRADLYSLGATLYDLVTGHPPFLAESISGVLRMHLSAPVEPPRSRAPALTPGTESLILRLLAKRPQERPGGPGEVIALIEANRSRSGARSGLAELARAIPQARP